MILEKIIEGLYERSQGNVDEDDVLHAVEQLKNSLNLGTVRAATCRGGVWKVTPWVKKGILLAFRAGKLTIIRDSSTFSFFDKSTMELKQLTETDNVRLVPGGSAIRNGAFVAPGVVIMPPSYINIGAYVDEQTMIDSHVLVGSCAQVGKRVHLSAGAQIGGVLEPIGSMPVIIEDDVLVGGNCGVYEGTIVRKRAVLGAGVILTGSTPVYDCVRNTVYRREGVDPLIIPEGAVVVPGTRALTSTFAQDNRLAVYAPVIIKYRDEKTDAATALETSLR